MSDILKMIDELVEQKTFSLDALSAIKALREEAKVQAAEIVKLKDSVKYQEAEKQRFERDLRHAESKLDKIAAREQAVAERESKITQLELDKAVASASLTSFKEACGMFLKNTIVRESVSSNARRPMPGPTGSYPIISDESGSESRTRETE